MTLSRKINYLILSFLVYSMVCYLVCEMPTEPFFQNLLPPHDLLKILLFSIVITFLFDVIDKCNNEKAILELLKGELVGMGDKKSFVICFEIEVVDGKLINSPSPEKYFLPESQDIKRKSEVEMN